MSAHTRRLLARAAVVCGFHGSTTGRTIGPDALSHRGPDHYGVFRDGNVVLEHWRLSIIDLTSNLYFGSELNALLLNRDIGVTLDVEAIQSLFHLLYIEGERTPFNEFRKLPPGCYLIYDLDNKSVQITRYHEFKARNNNLTESEC